MKSKLIVLWGDGKNIFNNSDAKTMLSSLQKRNDIEIAFINLEKNKGNIECLTNLTPSEKTTYLINSISDGYNFIFNDALKCSFGKLFDLIGHFKKPVDILIGPNKSKSCFLVDKHLLTQGSRVVSLIDSPKAINLDWYKTIKSLGDIKGDLTATNILDYYLINNLKTKSYPVLGLKTKFHIIHDAAIKNFNSTASVDSSVLGKLNEKQKQAYINVFNKMQEKKEINFDEYGIACSILLNDILKKEKLLNKEQDAEFFR
ncbi:MAG: hypothetical protein PHX09_00690 [Clostridia bacterium]|nr:hypothetical protein [Clostridia bacterium]MDD4685888.1 hypothetical protein [Clostridia bacterium]